MRTKWILVDLNPGGFNLIHIQCISDGYTPDHTSRSHHTLNQHNAGQHLQNDIQGSAVSKVINLRNYGTVEEVWAENTLSIGFGSIWPPINHGGDFMGEVSFLGNCSQEDEGPGNSRSLAAQHSFKAVRRSGILAEGDARFPGVARKESTSYLEFCPHHCIVI